MKQDRHIIFFLSLLIAVLISSGCSHGPVQTTGPKVYTAYNVWIQGGGIGQTLNYQVGTLIPAGTQVVDAWVSERGGNVNPGENSFIRFTVVETGKAYEVRYTGQYHRRRSLDDYYEAMFTDKSFDDLTADMSEDEKQAIKQGVIIKGMSKEAVVMSAGIPSDHRTPDMNSDTWYFWTSRHRSKKICFDDAQRADECEAIQRERENLKKLKNIL